jgi:hypothetical protein
MVICKLCKKNEADKKGSHIVPHFLLKRIENVDGKKGRDYELAYGIGEFETTSHFGRAVSPEKLEETYGELTEEEIAKNHHPLVVDFFFCSECENRISVIESEYAKTLNKKDTTIYSSGAKKGTGILFWMSVIWRMSINAKSGLQLKKEENEILRSILNRHLKKSMVDIDILQFQKEARAKRISYKLLRSPDYSETDFTLLMFDPRYRDPYSLLIDEYLLFFSFKSNYSHSKTKEFYSFNDSITNVPDNTIKTEEEQIFPLSFKTFANINQSVINKIRDIRVKNIELFLSKLHKSLGYPNLPPDWKQKVFAEITSEEKKSGRKYTIEDLKRSVIKVLGR